MTTSVRERLRRAPLLSLSLLLLCVAAGPLLATEISLAAILAASALALGLTSWAIGSSDYCAAMRILEGRAGPRLGILVGSQVFIVGVAFLLNYPLIKSTRALQPALGFLCACFAVLVTVLLVQGLRRDLPKSPKGREGARENLLAAYLTCGAAAVFFLLPALVAV